MATSLTAAALCAGCLAALGAGPAAAQAAPSARASGVVSYDAAAFAASRPETAYDMVRLTPGFTYDPGQDVRVGPRLLSPHPQELLTEEASMPRRIFALAAVLAVAASGLARAQPPTPAGPDLVRYRQASIAMSVFVRDQMKQAMKDGREAKAEAYASYVLARWAQVLPWLFPPGSGPRDTSTAMQARPEVWTDRAGFMRAAATFGQATDKLHDLAQANDTEGFKAQLLVVQQGCDGCHDRYKTGMMRPPAG